MSLKSKVQSSEVSIRTTILKVLESFLILKSLDRRKDMGKKKIILWVLVLCSPFIFLSAAGAAEKFPSKPVELVVPFAAGGSTDVLARLVANMPQNILTNPSSSL